MYNEDRDFGVQNKRNKPEHDSPSKEEEEAFKRSKLIVRSPTKDNNEGEDKIGEEDMEELKRMLGQISRDIGEMKEQLGSTNREIKEIKEEMRETNQKVDAVNQEMQTMKGRWEREKNELADELQKTNRRLELLDREKIRNNLVVSGVEMNARDGETLKMEMEKLLEREVKVNTPIVAAYKIGVKKYVVKMNNWEEKLRVLKGKNMLKGKDIYIEPEMTFKEREIQKTIRTTARQERVKGAKVKVRFQKLEIDDKILIWNHKEQKLTEATEKLPPKNYH